MAAGVPTSDLCTTMSVTMAAAMAAQKSSTSLLCGHCPASSSLIRSCAIPCPSPLQINKQGKPWHSPVLRSSYTHPSALSVRSNPASAPAVTPLSDLYDFICHGPLLSKVGLDQDSVAASMEEWLELGLRLSRQLGFNELFLSPEEKIRVYHYYIPVFMWCRRQLEQHRSQFKEGEVPPLMIGISAPQGCGKSTLVYSLNYLFNALGRSAVSVSIDDFYLTGEGQK